MKKYLAIAVLGLMLVLAQSSWAQCGCPVCPACPVQQVCAPIVQPACPVCQPACPVCPACPVQQVCAPIVQPACPVCQPVCPAQPVIQTVVEPVLSYRYRQIATCQPCCNPCGQTGAAVPIILMEEKGSFWSDFLGFD